MSQPHKEISTEGREQPMHALQDVKPEADEQTVIVEIDQRGAVRIRECPPSVVVMMVEGFPGERPEEVSPAEERPRKRSIGAGKRQRSQPTPRREPDTPTRVREIPVEFPG